MSINTEFQVGDVVCRVKAGNAGVKVGELAEVIGVCDAYRVLLDKGFRNAPHNVKYLELVRRPAKGARGSTETVFYDAAAPAPAVQITPEELIVKAKQALANAKAFAAEEKRKAAAAERERLERIQRLEKQAAEDKAISDFTDRLNADLKLAYATVAFIGEVQRLRNGGHACVAESAITKHANALDALAKSYGHKIVRAGDGVVVAKA